MRTAWIFILFSLPLWWPQAHAESDLITYFLEPRVGEPASRQVIRSKPLAAGEVLYQLTHHQLLRFQCTKQEYLERLVREQAGTGAWTRFTIDGANGLQDAYVFDYWKSFVTVDPSLQPVRLSFADRSRHVLTVFKEPGVLTWQACVRRHEECIAWPRHNSSMTLLDTRIVTNRRSGTRRLFYRVHYTYLAEGGWQREGDGWVPANAVRRMIERPPVFLPVAESNNEQKPAVEVTKGEFVPLETAQNMVREAEAKVLAQFNIQAPSEIEQRFSRWTRPFDKSREPGSEGASPSEHLNFKIDFDLEARAGTVSLNRKGRRDTTNVEEAVTGLAFSGVAPILWDFEAGGTLEFLKAVKRIRADGRLVDIVRWDQYLLYNLKSSPKGAAFKVGAGYDIQALTTAGTDYGMNAAIGVHAMGAFDSPLGSAYLKLGPAANTAGLLIRNLEADAGVTVRFQPEKGYESLAATSEVRYLTDTSNITGDRINMWVVLFGLQKTF